MSKIALVEKRPKSQNSEKPRSPKYSFFSSAGIEATDLRPQAGVLVHRRRHRRHLHLQTILSGGQAWLLHQRRTGDLQFNIFSMTPLTVTSVFWMGQPRSLFVYFFRFQAQIFTEKTVCFIRIQTRIVEVEGEHPDPLTTTMELFLLQSWASVRNRLLILPTYIAIIWHQLGWFVCNGWQHN